MDEYVDRGDASAYTCSVLRTGKFFIRGLFQRQIERTGPLHGEIKEALAAFRYKFFMERIAFSAFISDGVQ